MQLDAKRCPPGTVGFITPLLGDISGEDLDWFKQPNVVLGEDLVWRQIVGEDGAGDEILDGTAVYSDWQSAVRAEIQWHRNEARNLMEEAERLLAEAASIERLLNLADPAASTETE